MNYLGDESGNAAAEYALVLVLIAILVLVSAAAFGRRVGATFSAAANTAAMVDERRY
jgi:Flp pilus assembly pilin Flp